LYFEHNNGNSAHFENYVGVSFETSPSTSFEFRWKSKFWPAFLCSGCCIMLCRPAGHSQNVILQKYFLWRSTALT